MNTFFFNKIQKNTNLPASIPASIIATPLPASADATTTEIGFIILRHVNSSKTNEYWKECYRCIRYFYPSNKILIIDDNSDKCLFFIPAPFATLLSFCLYTNKNEKTLSNAHLDMRHVI